MTAPSRVSHRVLDLPVQLVTLGRSHRAPTVRAFLDLAAKSFQEVDVI